ncbi:MAG: copper amine oxidase N-terminal domain-containing protein [Firmicutes bacterium]|nr:copper amine oxidase N-terminal domain-containing protein [Bacillota bacterium]
MLLKKLPTFLLTATVVFSALSSVSAQNIGVNIDGEDVTFKDTLPIIVDNRTLVPLRDVFEKMGYTVTWDAQTKTVSLKNSQNDIVIGIGADSFIVNSRAHDIDVPALIIDGRTMLPLRAIAQSSGAKVYWDAEEKKVYILSFVNTSEGSSQYIETYEKEIAKLESLNELTELLKEVTPSNINSKKSQILSLASKAKEEITQVKSTLASLSVPSGLEKVHSLALGNLDQALKGIDLAVRLVSGEENSEELKDDIASALTESMALNNGTVREIGNI